MRGVGDGWNNKHSQTTKQQCVSCIMSLSDTGFPNTCCWAKALEISLTSQHVQVSSVETMRYAIYVPRKKTDILMLAGWPTAACGVYTAGP